LGGSGYCGNFVRNAHNSTKHFSAVFWRQGIGTTRI